MNGALWQFEHSVECGAPQAFAWKYWTNPENWDDPPARFEFDGPFTIGTRLTTILPGQRLQSVIQEVIDSCEAVIEMEMMRAKVRFRWKFEERPAGRARITQVIQLSGEGAEALLEQAKILAQTVPQGMKKLIAAIEKEWLAALQ